MATYRTLVVDNEVGMLEVCGDILRKLPDVEIVLESSSLRAADLLENENWDLLITDIRMPELSGVELLSLAREHDPGIAALIITAFPSVETAVASMKLGAADYITKPFLPDDFLSAALRLLEAKRLREEHNLLRRQIERPYSFGEMIGTSSAIQGVFEIIRSVSDTDADVLITGETGTGKELVARSLHQHSNRKPKRFVPVDCGAIPEDLLESEFFGHERGAFTGAHTRSLGLMEFADHGTLFLDEIGELPVRLQAKLLRTLQERKIRRIGGNSEIEVDVRVIAATARNLKEEIERERFRSDLYYRINVVRIKLPALRERMDDIPLLTNHFVEKYSREMNRPGVTFDDEAVEVLTGYAWPGNIRELQNIIKRVLATTRQEVIHVQSLPDEIVGAAQQRFDKNSSSFFDLKEKHVDDFEMEYFRKLMLTHKGDVTRAAAEAQLPRGTLYRLMNKHDLKPTDFRD